MTETPSTTKGTILLIHGLWMTPLCWENWTPYLESKGYKVIAPGWPGVDNRTPQEIRDDPHPMANKSIEEIVDSYAAVIKSTLNPNTNPNTNTNTTTTTTTTTEAVGPLIIMGHSFGGLFTQILLSRGIGGASVAAAVGIAPAQPAGVAILPPFSTIRATLPVLARPFDYTSTVKITKDQFHYCFGNHTTHAESDRLYERYAIPSVAHVLWEGVVGGLVTPHHNQNPNQNHGKVSSTEGGGGTYVEFGKPDRAPLLLIAGEIDHVVPHSVVEKEFQAYRKASDSIDKSSSLSSSSSPLSPVVEYKLFQGRSHGIVNQEGWEEVVDYALAFVEKHLKLQ